MTVPEGARVLVAGVGNIFFGDDGFGPAVIERVRSLADANLPSSVDVADYGIRGVHLAYQLLEGRHHTLVLVDALPMDEAPGTLSVMEAAPEPPAGAQLDAHAMSPGAVLECLSALGGGLPRVVVVGCQPGAFDTGMALSPEVAPVVDEAVHLVLEVARSEAAALAPEDRRTSAPAREEDPPPAPLRPTRKDASHA